MQTAEARRYIMYKRCLTIAFLLFSIFWTSGCFSQETPFSGNYSVITPFVGIGETRKPEYLFISGGFDYAKHLDSTLYRINVQVFGEFDLFSENYPPIRMQSINIMIGKYITWKLFEISGSVGVGLITGTRRGKFLYSTNSGDANFALSSGTNYYRKKPFVNVNLPLNVRATFNLFWYVGLTYEYSICLSPEFINEYVMFGFNINIP